MIDNMFIVSPPTEIAVVEEQTSDSQSDNILDVDFQSSKD